MVVDLGNVKMIPGYAYTSTKAFPVNPDTVIVGTDEVGSAYAQGNHWFRGEGATYVRFKVKGQRRYYFQLAHMVNQ